MSQNIPHRSFEPEEFFLFVSARYCSALYLQIHSAFCKANPRNSPKYYFGKARRYHREKIRFGGKYIYRWLFFFHTSQSPIVGLGQTESESEKPKRQKRDDTTPWLPKRNWEIYINNNVWFNRIIFPTQPTISTISIENTNNRLG